MHSVINCYLDIINTHFNFMNFYRCDYNKSTSEKFGIMMSIEPSKSYFKSLNFINFRVITAVQNFRKHNR